MIDAVNKHPAGRVSFSVLPGDNADDSGQTQFRLVRDAVEKLLLPLPILPGDHDFHSRTPDGFHSVLGAERLPKAMVAGSYRCLFLDIVLSGTGRPDFRLDDAQLNWTQSELAGDWPLILVTRPADNHLITDRGAVSQVVRDSLTFHAQVWSASRLRHVSAHIDGGVGRDVMTFLVSRDGRYTPPPRRTDGSDGDAWPEKGVLGTQLGPNRSGRKW